MVGVWILTMEDDEIIGTTNSVVLSTIIAVQQADHRHLVIKIR